MRRNCTQHAGTINIGESLSNILDGEEDSAARRRKLDTFIDENASTPVRDFYLRMMCLVDEGKITDDTSMHIFLRGGEVAISVDRGEPTPDQLRSAYFIGEHSC